MSEESTEAKVTGLSVAEKKGKPNRSIESADVTDMGFKGDHHAGINKKQVTLADTATLEKLSLTHAETYAPGLCKENIAVEGMDAIPFQLLDHIEVGPTRLEITGIGKRIGKDEKVERPKSLQCTLSDYGVFTRVITPGKVHVGDTIKHHLRTLKASVITLSDRAHAGEYEDRSGPRILEHLEQFAKVRHWTLETDTGAIPDDPHLLERRLQDARRKETHVVFTTGGTGIGPHDITPETVEKIADKTIPGVMDFIRMKYGAKRPVALLSRSVAATLGSTLIFTLPGSVRAVDEYMVEILTSLEHMIYIIKDIDPH
jgi:molybdenum cofactor synthesis domain-containing protein